MNAFWRATPWILRAILLGVTVLFTLISWRYLTDPVAKAATDEITLGSVMAVSRMRVGFGAFPLSFAILLAICLPFRRLLLTGLVALSVVIGVVTAARLSGLLIDGSAPEAIRLLRVELIVWGVSIAAIALEVFRRRAAARAVSPREKSTQTPARYHPALVTLHWVLAVFIVAALLLGMLLLKRIPNSSPDKIHGLRAHITGGLAIFALMLTRLIVRTTTAKPPDATAGHPALDRLARISHYGFYVLIFAMVGTGLATAIISGIFPTVFGGSADPLPPSFNVYPTRVLHGYIADTIIALIALHVAAVVYHQLIRRDRLLGRMWFGRRPQRSHDSLLLERNVP
jgi:cytochrome b561